MPEKLFVEGLVRLPNKKYQVDLLFDPNKRHIKLGSSRYLALNSLLQGERRRAKDKTFNQLYCEFMKQYIDLDHMEPVPLKNMSLPNDMCFYLPHHAVLKNLSTTTKLRVVFDGSAKSSTGYSLNDLLLCGNTIQDDIFSHLCRFRCYPIVILADIEKMYRQIVVILRNRDFLRILWRENLTDEIKEYRLKTVTYGTKSASFLAIRSLQQSAIDNQKEFPLASKVISRDFYVDNLITGVNTLEEGIQLQNDLLKITSNIFPLRQWASNEPKLVINLPHQLRDQLVSFDSNNNGTLNTLGLKWSPKNDQFCFTLALEAEKNTKRHILSMVSRIFDPLGLLSPILITPKIFLQSLWLHNLEWDEDLNDELIKRWKVIIQNLSEVQSIIIPRCVSSNVHNDLIIFGFCDASPHAYAAALYIGYINANNQLTTTLLCSKTRVAPLKNATIPRLELCGALLLSKLVKKLFDKTSFKISRVNLYCDSQIVLHWLASSDIKQPVFVSNRINQIRETLNDIDNYWYYVETQLNPADLATRGISATKLNNNSLWWKGPDLIRTLDDRETYFVKLHNPTIQSFSVVLRQEKDELNYIKKQSNFLTLLRITAFCLRFGSFKRNNRVKSFIAADEYKASLICLIRIHQSTYFNKEIHALRNNFPISNKSRILALSPFIDRNGLLRVGGRISQSTLDINRCHPYILTKDHFTNLLINYEHIRNCHANVQLLRTILLKNYWIINARSTIKGCIYNCLICLKLKSQINTQLMGELPKSRMTISRPFTTTGVDFAGPLTLKASKGRCNKTTKAWVALFICFSTRAIHLELVSELSVEAFIAALKRFVSRRRKPTDIYSDNGKNFIGSKSYYEEIKYFLNKEDAEKRIGNFLASDLITWHNIPVYTPHMGSRNKINENPLKGRSRGHVT